MSRSQPKDQSGLPDSTAKVLLPIPNPFQNIAGYHWCYIRAETDKGIGAKILEGFLEEEDCKEWAEPGHGTDFLSPDHLQARNLGARGLPAHTLWDLTPPRDSGGICLASPPPPPCCTGLSACQAGAGPPPTHLSSFCRPQEQRSRAKLSWGSHTLGEG